MEEGYIKYKCFWSESDLSHREVIRSLNFWRNILYDHHLIGAYPDGTGFGNISQRIKGNVFIITGSSTGNIPQLTNNHYSKVTDFDIGNNSLTCEGRIQASSESLSHAIIYKTIPTANAVVHIHSSELWERLINKAPTTSLKVTYGTPEMALEIERILLQESRNEDKLFVMGGHKDGIMTFGENLGEAVNKLLESLG